MRRYPERECCWRDVDRASDRTCFHGLRFGGVVEAEGREVFGVRLCDHWT